VTFHLAACAEMLYLELPFVERVKLIHEMGFQVEIWDWTSKDLVELESTGAVFSSMTGYVSGDLLTRNGIAVLLESASRSIEAAKKLGCARLNLHGTGLGANGTALIQRTEVTPGEWQTAVDTLKRIAALGEKHEQVFVLENLNTLVDHPGTPFAKARETIQLVTSVNNPYLKLNLDLYHAQIGEGNLISLIRDSYDYLGEIQVADVPGRFQPGTGEINYSRIGRELYELGYEGVVALEGWASEGSEAALQDFRRIMFADLPAG
jgi:hydroxypyruvate isomerase